MVIVVLAASSGFSSAISQPMGTSPVALGASTTASPLVNNFTVTSRVRRTRQLLHDALVQLLAKKTFAEISVGDVTRRLPSVAPPRPSSGLIEGRFQTPREGRSEFQQMCARTTSDERLQNVLVPDRNVLHGRRIEMSV